MLIALVHPAIAGEAPLTNANVIKMTQAGLSSDTILVKVRSSQTAFATDADSLVALARAGVPDAVIRAMVDRQAQLSVAPDRSEATVPKQPLPPARPTTPAPRKARRPVKRIDEVSVATPGGGRCDHATLEIWADAIKTSGCHETNLNAAWSEVKSVCYVFSFRSALVITTADRERRVYTTTPAELKVARDAIRAQVPLLREDSSCR